MPKVKKESRQFIVINEEKLISEVEKRSILYDKALKGYRKPAIRETAWQEVANILESSVEECKKRWRSLRDAFMKQYKLYSRGDANVKKKWLFYEQMEFLGPYFDNTEFKYEGDDYIETIQAETDSMDKPNIGPQIVCINTDGGEYTHQIEVDEYQEDQLDEETLETSQYHLNSKGAFKESSSVYYITAPTSNSTNTVTDSHQPQHSSQRQTKMVSNSTITLSNDSDERFLLSCLPIMKRLPTRKNALARLRIQQLLYEIEFDAYSDASGQ